MQLHQKQHQRHCRYEICKVCVHWKYFYIQKCQDIDYVHRMDEWICAMIWDCVVTGEERLFGDSCLMSVIWWHIRKAHRVWFDIGMCCRKSATLRKASYQFMDTWCIQWCHSFIWKVSIVTDWVGYNVFIIIHHHQKKGKGI